MQADRRAGDARQAFLAPVPGLVEGEQVHVDALDACPSAVLAYTDEALIDEHGDSLGVRRLAYSAFQHAHSASHVHGLIVMRRSAVDPVLTRIADLDAGADWLLTRLVARQGSVLHLPLVGRHWRQHPNQHHRRGRSKALGSLPSVAIP